MIDTFFERRRELNGEVDEEATDAAALLAELVKFAGAHQGKLIRYSGQCAIVYATAQVQDGEVQTTVNRSERLDGNQLQLVRQALSSGCMVASGLSTLCVPMAPCNGIPWALHLKALSHAEGFSDQVVSAIKLFGKMLECLLDRRANLGTMSLDDTAATPRLRKPIEESPSLSGIDPVVLAGVAESMAIKINDSLSSVVAHAGAGLQWLNQETPKLEQARQSLRKIASSSFAIGAMISGFRSASQSSGQAFETVDLQDVIASALEQLAPDLLEAKVRIDCDLSVGSEVLATARQIEQAIVNLISIAADSMQQTSHQRKISISSTMQDRYLVLSISDTGPSIPSEGRDAIFDPSYTAKEGNKGVKLAIARTIAQLHGGNLEIARSDDEGTTMLLKLPAKICN